MEKEAGGQMGKQQQRGMAFPEQACTLQGWAHHWHLGPSLPSRHLHQVLQSSLLQQLLAVGLPPQPHLHPSHHCLPQLLVPKEEQQWHQVKRHHPLAAQQQVALVGQQQLEGSNRQPTSAYWAPLLAPSHPF
jgi:hypothetical protein